MVPSHELTEWKCAINPRGNIRVRVIEDGSLRDYWIPPNPANSDYVAYQAWLAEGNIPDLI